MSDIIVEPHDHVTAITLNCAEKLNAIHVPMADELTEAMQEFDNDPEQYVAIITGAGDRAFSSGSDLNAMAESASGTAMNVGARSVDLWGSGRARSRPSLRSTAWQWRGVRTHLVVRHPRRFRHVLVRAVRGEARHRSGGRRKPAPALLPLGEAMYLLLTTGRMSVDDALRHGLVQRVVPQADVLDTALEIARQIAANSQVAVQALKQIAQR